MGRQLDEVMSRMPKNTMTTNPEYQEWLNEAVRVSEAEKRGEKPRNSGKRLKAASLKPPAMVEPTYQEVLERKAAMQDAKGHAVTFGEARESLDQANINRNKEAAKAIERANYFESVGGNAIPPQQRVALGNKLRSLLDTDATFVFEPELTEYEQIDGARKSAGLPSQEEKDRAAHPEAYDVADKLKSLSTSEQDYLMSALIVLDRAEG